MRRLLKSCPRHRVAAVGVAVSLGAVALGCGAASAASGDLDRGFGGAAHGRAEFDLGSAAILRGLAVQPGGGMVSVGETVAGATADAVAYRLHADGSPDASFGMVTLPGPTDAEEVATAAVAQPDGKVVVAGTVTDRNGFTDLGVWRLRSSGALDTTFGDQGILAYGVDNNSEAALDVAVDPQGRIVVAGYRVGVNFDIAVLRLTPGGQLDPTFSNGPLLDVPHSGNDEARSVAVQSDGEIIVSGDYAGVVGNALLRIEPGTATTQALVDPDFGVGGIAEVPGTVFTNDPDVAVAADGKVLVLGQVPAAGGSVDGTVVRLTSSGTVDEPFGGSFGSATGVHIDVNGGDDTLQALTVLPHGGVAVVGNGDGGRFVAKLRAGGTPDLAMGPGGVRNLPALVFGATGVAALPDGRIIALGQSDSSTGVAYRLLGDLKAPSCAGKKATIVGTKASDRLVGTARADVIAGLGGSDKITGLGKGDVVCGGAGGDHIAGGAGADHLYGQAGPDTLSGGTGRDKLVGGAGHDTLKGGPGHDTVVQ